MRGSTANRNPRTADRRGFWIGAAILSGIALVSCSRPGPAPAGPPCRPPVAPVNWNGLRDEAASTRLKVLFDAHQASRSTDQMTLAQVLAEDEVRRTEVMAMLRDGRVGKPGDYYSAGVLFLYSTCADHQHLAMDLARHAWERGVAEAWTLYTQAAVRFLQNRGTQVKSASDGARIWPDLDPINQQFNKVEEGVFRVPVKLAPSLEADRGALERAILEAQRRTLHDVHPAGGGPPPRESLLDRAAIFDDEPTYSKVVEQLLAEAAGKPGQEPSAVLSQRALVALSPALAVKRDPGTAGGESYIRLLTQAIKQAR